MLSKLTLASSTLLLATIASAQTVHEIQALENPYRFEPDTLEGAEEGDSIRVTFSSEHNHNILSGSWEMPCTYNSDIGVNSGVWGDGEVFTFMVNSTDPQIYFCSVGMHCQAGMVLAVNPSGDETLNAYTSEAASATTDAPNDEGPVGGMMEDMMDGMDDDADSAAAGLRGNVAMAVAALAGVVAFVV